MGRKCCAPKCRSGYKGKSKDGISMHKFRAEWKSNFPRGDWKVTDQTFICSKHFTASDFITERRDSNTTRIFKRRCISHNLPQLPTVFVTKEIGKPTIPGFNSCKRV